MTDAIRIDVDPGKLFERAFTELEQSQLPYAAMKAANGAASEIAFQWERLLDKRLDRPTPFTQRSVNVRKARYTRNGDGTREMEAAVVFIRDFAGKGTAPAQYLLPQVYGGAGHDRGIDKGLQRAGILRLGERAVTPADGAMLDAYGNIPGGVVNQILSQLQGRFDPNQNETEASRKRNNKRGARAKKLTRLNRRFFAVMRYGENSNALARTRHLSPGIYMRDGKFGLTKVYNFVGKVHYTERLDLFGAAKKAWEEAFPFYFTRELAAAVAQAGVRA